MKKGIDEVNYKKIFLAHVIYSQIFLFLMSFILSFVFIYYGVGAISAFLDMLPETILHALSQLAKVLPAVGMALLLKYNISNKVMFIFFIFGFMLFSYAGMTFIPIAIIGLVVAFFFYRTDSSNDHSISNFQEEEEAL